MLLGLQFEQSRIALVEMLFAAPMPAALFFPKS
jgi:hypothetical protein